MGLHLASGLIGYPWFDTDAGRSTSKHSKQKNDCTVRALATTLEITYDEAYSMLAKAGRKSSCKFRISDWLETQPWAEKISFPAVKGEHRMNPVVFTKKFSSGAYICKTAGHVFAVIDGTLYDDTENRPDRCIYTAWRISK